MPAQLSKEVIQMKQSCRFLLSALTKQGEKVATLLFTLIQPYLVEGDEAPGFGATIVGLKRRLSASLTALIVADRDLFKVNASLSTLRDRRNELAIELGQEIVRVRQAVDALYLKPNLEALALQSPRLYRADPLLEQADMLMNAFERDDLETLLREGISENTVVPLATVRRVEKAADVLRSVLIEIDDARRDFDEAVLEKRSTKAAHVEIFIYTARSFEASCRLAGLRDLAERVRPSERRRGVLAQEPIADPPPIIDPPPDEDGFVPLEGNDTVSPPLGSPRGDTAVSASLIAGDVDGGVVDGVIDGGVDPDGVDRVPSPRHA